MRRMGKWGSPEDRAIITDTSGRLSRDRDSDRIHMRGGQQTRAVSKDLETREVTTRGNDTDNRPEDRVGNISREEAGYKETEQEIALNTRSVVMVWREGGENPQQPQQNEYSEGGKGPCQQRRMQKP